MKNHQEKTISYISIFLYSSKSMYSSKSILIVIICNQSTNIYEVFFNETIHIIIGQNGPLALIFEIFSNRALFRK